MKCSRCAAELPDSSIFCSTCGAANPSGQLTTSNFSYLPAGAPPWPTSAPGKYPYGASSSTPVQPAISQVMEKSGRSMARSIMTVALILLITLLVGVGGTLGVLAGQGRFSSQPVAAKKKVVVAQAQPTPAPTTSAQGNQLPTPTSFTLASVKDVNVALEYPAGWVQDALQKSTDSTSLGIHSPQAEQIGISFFLTRFSNSASAGISSPDQINQSNVQQFSQLSGVSNVQTVPSNGGAPTIGGANWMELGATFMNSNNVKMDLISMSVERNKVYYNIAVITPDVYSTEAMQKYIQHMLTTFKFLS